MLYTRALAGRVLSLLAFVPSLTTAFAASNETTSREASRPERDDNVDLTALKERLGTGDADAFERIFRHLSEPTFRFVCGMVQEEALAHDITQDTFATLWEMRDRMDQVEALRPYVFQMARNRVYNQQRDAQTRRDHDEALRNFHAEASPPSPDADTEASMLQSRLEAWIEELPRRQREALCLCRQQDLSHQEIAQVMDIAPSTVNNHIVRAMEHLRSRLREHHPSFLA